MKSPVLNKIYSGKGRDEEGLISSEQRRKFLWKDVLKSIATSQSQ